MSHKPLPVAPADEHAQAVADRLGLPAHGPLSLAPLGKRVIALFIDWALALGVVHLWGMAGELGRQQQQLLPTVVFFVMTVISVSLTGSSIGHRLMGLQVVALGRSALTPVAVLLRTFLICLVIPAVVWDADGRGLHDRLAGTAIVLR